MSEIKTNLENVINLNNVKGEIYESPIIEKIKVIKGTEDQDPLTVTEDEKKRYLNINREAESQHDNIHVGKNNDLYVLKGDEPRFTKDLATMHEKEKNLKQGFWDNLADMTKDKALEGVGALSTGAAMLGVGLRFIPTPHTQVAATGLSAIAAAGKALVASTAVKTAGGATIAAGLGMLGGTAYHNIETNNLKKEIEDIIAKGIKSKSDIVDVNNIFDDPYLNSIAPLLSTKDKNDNYMFPKETRDKIMDLEEKKIQYSKIFADYINTYNNIKDSSSEQELADLTKNFNKDLKDFNDFKYNKINEISNNIIALKNDRVSSDSINPYLMDARTFYSLKELSYLDNAIVSLDRDAKAEGVNAIYGSNDIEKIKGSIKMLELGAANKNIFNLDKINSTDINKNANLTEMKNNVSDLSKRIDNYNNLSNEEKAKFFNDYKELTVKLNNHVEKTINNVNKDQLDFVKHLKDKDFISTSKIDKVIENEVKISEKSIKESDLSEEVKTTINNETQEKNQKSFSSLSNNW